MILHSFLSLSAFKTIVSGYQTATFEGSTELVKFTDIALVISISLFRKTVTTFPQGSNITVFQNNFFAYY
jgi:hypothetical protein